MTDTVDTLLSRNTNDVDISDFMSESEQAEAFRELVAVYALYEYERGLNTLENRSERLSRMEEFIRDSFTYFVNRKERMAA